jgi:hypothetical protein
MNFKNMLIYYYLLKIEWEIKVFTISMSSESALWKTSKDLNLIILLTRLMISYQGSVLIYLKHRQELKIGILTSTIDYLIKLLYQPATTKHNQKWYAKVKKRSIYF